MSRSLDVILFCLYTAASVAGLIIINAGLAPAQVAWQAGSFLSSSGWGACFISRASSSGS
jgi:hypothetical protein